MRFDEFARAARITRPAVVIGGNKTGLGAVRNLATNGVPTLLLDTDPGAVGFRSRHTARGVCPDAHYDRDAFIDTLRLISDKLPQRPVLQPCQDDAVYTCSQSADRLEKHYLMPFARWDAMRLLASKEEQIKAAWRAGVNVPKTAFIRHASDLAEAAASVPFPAVLKSSEHLAFRRRHMGKALPITRREDLDRVYAGVRDCGTLMLQGLVPGRDDQLYTLQVYMDHGSEPLAAFVRHKIRQHPRQFGECRFGESQWVPEVAEAGMSLLRGIGYHGMAGVEFKRDTRDGVLKFMEVNARHVSWHALATALGINFTLVAYQDAVGRPFKAPPQVDGPRWIWTAHDVPDSVREIARGELSPVEWLTSLRGTRVDGVLSLRDPAPGVFEIAQLVRRGLLQYVRRLTDAV